MKTFRIPRHLPPEFKALPLDLLRTDSWPVWPYKVQRGLEAYPSPNATPLPISAGADPISNAKEAVACVLASARALAAYEEALRPVRDLPIAKAVRHAQYAGMEEITYARTNPPQQSVPWIDHQGIWPEPDATAEFMQRLIYPGVPAGIAADYLSVFNKKRRQR